MCGVGRAHLGMGEMVANLRAPRPLGLPDKEKDAFVEDIYAEEDEGDETRQEACWRGTWFELSRLKP